jgi:hypothetical protein
MNNSKSTITSAVALLLMTLTPLKTATAFTLQPQNTNIGERIVLNNKPIQRTRTTQLHANSAVSDNINVSGKGFANQSTSQNQNVTDDVDDQIMKMNATQLKEKLLDLLPRMTGTSEEFKSVESYVNALEDKFMPPQTLDFLNLAMVGEWQFLFTSNQLGRPSPKLRLTELVQQIEVDGFDGKMTNKVSYSNGYITKMLQINRFVKLMHLLVSEQASWDLAQDGMIFDARGSFASNISYNINQGARMTVNDDHDLRIELDKGSVVPNDTQELVGLIHRAMPSELFDSSDLAMDTTYLDTDIRIVRFTGTRHEGVRNIFMRKGLIEINPSGMDMQ